MLNETRLGDTTVAFDLWLITGCTISIYMRAISRLVPLLYGDE
jgi:hypothetical protein